MTNILFVCTGNTCRSPMAKGYLESKNLSDVSVQSAGIFADNSPVSSMAAKVCKNHSIDISKHISKSLTKQMVDNADFILCMSESHRDMLIPLCEKPKKVLVLGSGIPDPYSGDEQVYEDCFLSLSLAIDRFCERYL